MQTPVTAPPLRLSNGFSKSREDTSTHHSSPITLKCFFVHDVRHLCRIAAVVAFENVDQSLHTPSRHAFVWIDIKTRDLRTAGEMMEDAATVRNFQIKQGRIRWERLFFEHVERSARNDPFFQRFRERFLVQDRATRTVY